MVWRNYMTGSRGLMLYNWVSSHWWSEGSAWQDAGEWWYTIGWLVTDGWQEVHARPMIQEDLHVQQQHCESIKSWVVWNSCEFYLFWRIQFRTFSNITCCVIEGPHLMFYVWCCLNMSSLSILQHMLSQHNCTHMCSDIPATCFSCRQPS
jgi:hypothetical protein